MVDGKARKREEPLRIIIDVNRSYNFQPYAYTLQELPKSVLLPVEWRSLAGASGRCANWRLLHSRCDRAYTPILEVSE